VTGEGLLEYSASLHKRNKYEKAAGHVKGNSGSRLVRSA